MLGGYKNMQKKHRSAPNPGALEPKNPKKAHFGACANFGAQFLGRLGSVGADIWWEAELGGCGATKKFRAPSVEKKCQPRWRTRRCPEMGPGGPKKFRHSGLSVLGPNLAPYQISTWFGPKNAEALRKRPF